jgi:hypothetical protein
VNFVFFVVKGLWVFRFSFFVLRSSFGVLGSGFERRTGNAERRTVNEEREYRDFSGMLKLLKRTKSKPRLSQTTLYKQLTKYKEMVPGTLRARQLCGLNVQYVLNVSTITCPRQRGFYASEEVQNEMPHSVLHFSLRDRFRD